MTKKKNEEEKIREQETIEAPVTEEKPEESTEELKKALEEMTSKADENYDMFLRERASFINFKKRNEQAVSKAYQDSRNDTVSKLLPVLDNLERALEASSEDSPLKEGIELTRKQMVKILEDMGIKEMDCLGKPFDPAFHNAVMQADPEEGEESGIIKQVLQKGYTANDTVIRHSMVIVTR